MTATFVGMDSLFSINRCYLGANDFAPGIGVLVG
jgi:hypothetical protein